MYVPIPSSAVMRIVAAFVVAVVSFGSNRAGAEIAPAIYSYDGHTVAGPGSYLGVNFDTVTLGAIPAPFLHIDLDIPSDPNGSILGGGSAGITYYYHILGAPTATGLVATQITTTMSLSGTGGRLSGGTAFIGGSNIPQAGICWPLGECGNNPFPNNPDLNIDSQFFSGVLNELIPFNGEIDLSVTANGGTLGHGSTTFSGRLDPVITVPDGYTITFSDGIGNAVGAVAAVPEPPSYTMLLAGLGFLGFIARPRKRDAASSC